MNKPITLLILLIICIQTHAQRSVILDYNTNFPKQRIVNVSFKDTILIIVNNVNRKIFKVETNETKSDYNITLPAALKGIKLPAFINLSSPETEEVSIEPKKGLELDQNKSLFSDADSIIAGIKARAMKLNNSVLLYNSLQNLFKDCSLSGYTIQNQMRKMTYDYLEPDGNFSAYTSEQLYLQLRNTLLTLRPEADSLLQLLQVDLPDFIKGEKEDMDDDIEMLELAKERGQEYLKSNRLNQKYKTKIIAEMQRVSAKIQKFQETKKAIKETEAVLKDEVKKAEDLVDAMAEFERDDKINTLLTLYKVMDNPKNYFFSDIIVPKKDETKYTITITPQDINACGSLDSRKSELTFNTKGGLKIDFSTGVFLLGGSESFLGQTYYWESIDSVTRRIITAKRGTRLQLGIGALAHFYKRSYKPAKLAISTGVSTSAGFDNLNFHIGPTLIFGNKDRFILTAGLALKSTEVLDRQLKTNVAYRKDNSPDDIPTISQFPKSGWFIGLTYNLSRFKSE